MEVERKSSARGQIGMIDPERTTRPLVRTPESGAGCCQDWKI